MKLKATLRIIVPAFALMFFSSGDNFLLAQARIVFGTVSDVYMVMSSNAVVGGNPIYLVIGDATAVNRGALPNTLTRTTKGAIISNGENNIIKWFISDKSGAYKIPWAYGTIASYAGNYIPFTLNIPIGKEGTDQHFLNFSTYQTATYNNLLYVPSGVANTWSSACACDASPYMVDRFWQLDNADYGVGTPDGDLTFYYVDQGAGTPEVLAAGSLLTAGTESNLQAESYNNSANKWVGSLFGTDDPVNDFVGSTGNISKPKLDRWWTLVEKNHPLPVEFLRESAECNGGAINIKWSTASEQNSDFFTVEKSADGTNFSEIAHVLAAGNSSSVKNYSAVDAEPFQGVSYYRIRETDFNSSSILSEVMTVNGCSNDDIFVYGSEGGISVNINALEEGKYNFELYDALGQKLMNDVKGVAAGENHLRLSVSNIASAMYVVKVFSASNSVTKKVFIRSAYTQ